MFKKLLFAAGALAVLTFAQENAETTTEVTTETTETVEAPVTETTETVETVTETTTETAEAVTTEEAPVEEVVVVTEEVAVVENEEGFTASGTISGSGSATGSVTVTNLDINGASTIVVPTAALIALAALLN